MSQKQAGLDDRNWSMAAGAVDYDKDGDQDLYLLNYGPNVFYRNNGNGTFTDITNITGTERTGKAEWFYQVEHRCLFLGLQSRWKAGCHGR